MGKFKKQRNEQMNNQRTTLLYFEKYFEKLTNKSGVQKILKNGLPR